jgi:hypothetical protein
MWVVGHDKIRSDGYSTSASLFTLISFFSFRLKHAQITFLCPGLRPSATEGMERMLSAMENRISSLLMKSEYEISSVS